MAFLEIDQIEKRYEGAPLLDGISIAIERGEIISLLGPSGSGKTTLLRIIAGLERAEAGQVRLAGRDVARVPVHQRGIVLMFQEYTLFPHRTVVQNVAFGLRMHHRPRAEIETRVADMLALVGLSGFEDRSVTQLSGGERQRVALARSLAPEPDLLLLDEPLGSLDRNLRERLLEDLSAILRRVGVTAIAVTHDQTEAFALASRVAILHGAQIVQTGTPREIYQDPVSPWVARFLGLVNLFSARLTGSKTVALDWGELALGSPIAKKDGADAATGTLLILPWGIRLTDGLSSSENPFTATVTRVIFQGRTTKIHLQLEDAPPEADITLSLIADMGTPVPDVGDRVRGEIAPDALRWFPASASR